VLIGIRVILVRIVDDLWVVSVHVNVLVVILCHVSVSLMIAHVRMLFVEIFLMFCKLSCSDSKDQIFQLEQVFIQMLKLLP